MDDGPILLWFRQDLRLADNPALHAAVRAGRPVIPLFVLEGASDGRPWGGASAWWLERSLAALDDSLKALGSRLILRRGDAAEIVPDLARKAGAAAVMWNRLYGGHAMARDAAIEAALQRDGIEAHTFKGSLLVEPSEVRTGAGGAYQVFTPFWRAARAAIGGPEVIAPPKHIPPPAHWPHTEALKRWDLYPGRPDWARDFDWTPGEAGATRRLHDFLDEDLRRYAEGRDHPGKRGGSRLSPHLHWGEVSPARVWRAGEGAVQAGLAQERDFDKFLGELGWREFNHHLLAAHPDLATVNVKRRFDAMPWRSDRKGVAAWKAGRTGYPLVDAGMRELWATGFMHNRVRMIAASFLIKHLLVDWREGEAWFWDTLVDADEANNPGNWQWTAGSGVDASPFFRIFNPTAQGERFDPDGAYVKRWVPELAHLPAKYVHSPWTAPAPPKGYPAPIVDHAQARARALEAFRGLPKTDDA